MKLSAILFIYWPEEELYVEACLKTISWVDEIVVIDNGATVKTVNIVKKYTDKVFRSDSDSFSARHNLGKDKASGDWLFYIDADERISKKLQIEIQNELSSPAADSYQIRRTNYFLGKQVRFGDRYPDYVARLFKKDQLLDWEGEIHESSKTSGKTARLQSELYHLTHRDIYSMMEKTMNFQEYEARLRLNTNHPQITGWRLLRVFTTEMFTRLIGYQGWRGGTEGWIDGIFQSFSLFIAYARLWELQRKPSLKESYKLIDKKILDEFA